MSGAMSVQADKLSPDTRLRIENRGKKFAARISDEQAETMRVFIAFEKGFDLNSLLIPGVTLQSVFEKVVTADATVAAIRQLAEMDGVRYIQMASDTKLLNDWGRADLHVDDVHSNTGNALTQGFTGKGVVVGMIDLGVEYGHHAFYASDGSGLRIRRAWQQNDFNGPHPAGYDYGRELTSEAEMLLQTYDSKSDFHGSHTMGTAAGGGDLPTKYYGMAPDADIVFVSFNSQDNTTIADGIKYIFDYADEMDMPCVINMSIGSHHGPHDGTSFLDQIIDEMSGPGRIIVGACGNEGESRMHASKTFTESDKTMKTMLTFSDKQSHKLHYLDIWGTPGSNLKVRMAVFNSLKGQLVDQGNVFDTNNPNQSVVGYFTYMNNQGIDMDAMVYGEINPENNSPHVWVEAEVLEMGQGRMPGLIIEGDPGATVHVWNEGLHEFSSNNKSGFTDGDQNCTVGEVGGTAKRIISVGSYDSRESIPVQRNYKIDMSSLSTYQQYRHSVFSSYGPTADGRIVPTVVAPGMPVISALNRYAMSSEEIADFHSDYTTGPDGRKYYYFYNMGTSMSAPHVAGIVALMLQANPELTPEQAKDIMQSTADTWAEMGEVPNNSYGAGRINALNCVKEALALGDPGSVEAVDVADNSTRVWGSDGMIHVLTPAVGATLRIYSVTGAILHEQTLDSTSADIDASQFGYRFVVAEVIGESSRSSFKIAL